MSAPRVAPGLGHSPAVPDYHIHTSMCGHASGTIEELVESAISCGFSEIGIADHLPLTYIDDRTLSMSAGDLPSYVEQVMEARERYRGRIEVRLGIEADYHAETIDRIEAMLAAHPFDYVIGSVHAIYGWAFDDPRTADRLRELDLDSFYLEYLKTEVAMVRTGLYDIVGHADLVKKFDNRASVDLTSAYGELLEAILDTGMCYEVNTAGLRWPAREMYPEPSFVRLGAKMGVPVTLGSDAHGPSDVGRDFDLALELVRSAGYTRVEDHPSRAATLVALAPDR